MKNRNENINIYYPRILEFNPEHPLIRDLIKLYVEHPENKKMELVVLQLIENYLLSEGDLPEPATMVPRINQILEMFITGKEDIAKIEPKKKESGENTENKEL